MKVGIVTFIDYENYGNRLQNYALQCILESYGCEVETILHEKYYDYKYTQNHLIKLPLHVLKSVYWWFYERQSHDRHEMRYISEMDALSKKRVCRNINFSEKYIKETSKCLHEGNINKKDFKKYDVVFVGSDQVWNPEMAFCMDMYMLQYVPYGKRASFAASIGIEKIPDELEHQWSKYIREMNYISVREKSAKELLSEYCDKEVEVVLDPTLLVETRVWEEVRKDSSVTLPEKYIVTYILGELSEEEENYLYRVADEAGASLIRLNDKKYEEKYIYDVSDFVNCISNAEVVITDSFHAAVFSIIFKKEFYVLKRKGEFEGIYSRITDLLDKVAFTDRELNSIGELTMGGRKACCYENVEGIIEQEKRHAGLYLKRVLGEI